MSNVKLPKPKGAIRAPNAVRTVSGPHRSLKKDFARRLWSQRPAVIAAGFLGFMGLIAVVAPILPIADPNALNLEVLNQPPSSEFLLGTDDIGRDILSRIVFASRLSLLAGAQATLIAATIGVPLGLISGYAGGSIDFVIMRMTDLLLSIPGLLLAITLVGILGPGLRNAMLAIGVVFAPRFIRVVRARALSVRQELYIDAATIAGAPNRAIITRHILPNCLSPLLVQATLTMALALLAEASLSFLGLGVQSPDASWGSMLGRAWRFLGQRPWNVLPPGILIMLTVLSLNVLGDSIREAVGREVRHGI